MTMRLGPDPNRSFLQRHNEMFPQRYGLLGPAREANGSATRQVGDSEAGSSTVHDESFVDSLYGFIVLGAGLVIGVLTTFLVVKFIRPESLSASWILGYIATFFVSAYVGAMIAYAVRRIVLAVLIVTSMFGAGYGVYHLWMA